MIADGKRLQRHVLHAFLLAILLGTPIARGVSPLRRDDVWGKLEGQVASRDFYGLMAMADDVGVRRILAADPMLAALRKSRDAKLNDAVTTCHDEKCFDDAFRWSEADITTVSGALQQLATQSPAFGQFIEKTLRGSGRFALYEKETNPELVVSAWKDAANAMNRILAVYGEGKPPLYARIDSMRYSTKSSEFIASLQGSAALIAAQESSPRPFFIAAMKYAVLLLAANDRLDAGRFEPLESTENKAAVQRVKTMDWKRYPYSVIVVPGEGPEQPDVELSPLGRIRVEQAVRLYREGKAPFLLVSGGTVHPALTKFDEAIEMRKELQEQWGIPENAILIDPYARHTTTNLRNASREMIRYGIPENKPMLIASNAAQISLIMSPAFDTRCMREMHLRPWRTLTQLTPIEAVMVLNRDSLQEDAEDPLDP